MKQFSDVNTSRGAPMGRPNALALDDTPKSIKLFQVNLDAGGYDDGGAYWGHTPISPYRGHAPFALWCARDSQGNEQFVRAFARITAAAILEIPISCLQRGFSRYDVDFYFRNFCEKRMPPALLESADWEWWFEHNGYTIFDGSIRHAETPKI